MYLLRMRTFAAPEKDAGDKTYIIVPDKQTCANSVELDQTPQNAVSDHGLHYLPFINYF